MSRCGVATRHSYSARKVLVEKPQRTRQRLLPLSLAEFRTKVFPMAILIIGAHLVLMQKVLRRAGDHLASWLEMETPKILILTISAPTYRGSRKFYGQRCLDRLSSRGWGTWELHIRRGLSTWCSIGVSRRGTWGAGSSTGLSNFQGSATPRKHTTR